MPARRILGVSLCMMVSSFILGFRPYHALVLLSDRRDALVNEFLYALAAISFRREDIALRIGCNAMDSIEFAGLAPSFAERRQHFEGIAIQDVHPVVLAVSEVDVLLPRILGERDVPRRSRPERAFLDERFFDEGAVRFEDLNAVI